MCSTPDFDKNLDICKIIFGHGREINKDETGALSKIS